MSTASVPFALSLSMSSFALIPLSDTYTIFWGTKVSAAASAAFHFAHLVEGNSIQSYNMINLHILMCKHNAESQPVDLALLIARRGRNSLRPILCVHTSDHSG